jgi:hypothetical protein
MNAFVRIAETLTIPLGLINTFVGIMAGLWLAILGGGNTHLRLMVSKKIVTPVKTGVQRFYNYLKRLDSGFSRNDENVQFLNF